MSKNLLMLAYFFPPTVVSGSVRPASFTAHLGGHGFRTHVLTTPPESVQPPAAVDDSLEKLIPSDVQVTRLAYTDWRVAALRARDRLRGKPGADSDLSPTGQAASSVRAGNDSLLGRTRKLLLERIFMFPDQQKDWARTATKYGRKLRGHQAPEVVFATGSPWSSLLAGARIAASHGVPFVADFRDPWTVNTRIGGAPSLQAQARKLERFVVDSATVVVANTPALRDWFCSEYPNNAGKFVAITNGINGQLLSLLDSVEVTPPEGSIPLDICYFGSVLKQRIPRSLLGAIDELLSAGQISAEQLTVTFTGPWAQIEPALADVLRRLEEAGIVRRRPAVPYDECIRQMQASGMLLVLQQGFPLQIPAKIYEYIATGRPILLVGGEGATQALLESGGYGVACADEVAAVKAALLELLGRETVGLEQAAADHSALHYEHLTGQLAAVLDRAIEEYRA